MLEIRRRPEVENLLNILSLANLRLAQDTIPQSNWFCR